MTYIYITDINKILVSDTVFIILKENYEVIKFFKDEEKMSDLVSLANIVASNARDLLKKTIKIHKVSTLTDEVTHITPHFNKNINFSSLVYQHEAFYLDSFNNIRKVFLRVDRENLHVMKESTTGIFVSAKLYGLKFVYVYDVMPLVESHAELCNLRLVFNSAESEIDLKIYFKKREELLSVIFTLRKINKNCMNELSVFFNDVEFYEKYLINMPCTYTLDDYEVNILKELKALLSQKKFYDSTETNSETDFSLFYLLDEVTLNCKFININKVDTSLLETLFEFIAFVFRNMETKSKEEKDR